MTGRAHLSDRDGGDGDGLLIVHHVLLVLDLLLGNGGRKIRDLEGDGDAGRDDDASVVLDSLASRVNPEERGDVHLVVNVLGEGDLVLSGLLGSLGGNRETRVIRRGR